MRSRLSRKRQGRKSKKRRAAHRGKANLQSAARVVKAGSRVRQEPKARRQDSASIARWLESSGNARALIDLAHDAVIIRDPESRVESWSVGATRLYGWTAKEALGQITHALLDTQFPASKEAVNDALLGQGYWEGELQHRRKDGARIVAESRQSLLRDSAGKPLLITEINRDITQQQRQLSYLRLLGEVSASVNEARTVEDALRWSLASICIQTNWCAARACTVNSGPEVDGTALASSIWFLSDENRFGPFRDALECGPKPAPQRRIVERAFTKKEHVWIRDLRKDVHFAGILDGIDVHCAYAFPVALGPKDGVVVILFSDVPKDLDEAFSGTMSGVGRHLARLFERLGAEESQRVLSVSLMRAQDDERRRIARELHDSTGQYLSALSLAIDAARSHVENLPPAATRKLEEATEIINRCSAEIRTLSHLLHPPLLEDLGLASAVNWHVEGFAERSGVMVDLQLPAPLARFDRSVELTLFRILQECLTNIHRHSGSKTASVKIQAEPERVALEVRDEGKGIGQEMLGNWFGNKKRSGVGISGMRERVKDLGGTLEIQSSSKGTVVRATIPVIVRPATTPGGELPLESANVSVAKPVGAGR
jgi:PAS domain S-box-containing protein